LVEKPKHKPNYVLNTVLPDAVSRQVFNSEKVGRNTSA